MANSAMLWTGGKDSALALHESLRAGHNVTTLVTFTPPNPTFLAHPLPILALQAKALNLPHLLLPITAPYESSYELALATLRDTHHIDTLITGDIDLVNGQPNWITQLARPLNLLVHTPLWHRDRLQLLHDLLAAKFKIILSCVDTHFLPPTWVGREITPDALTELIAIHQSNNLDLCGENGEFHTLTLHSPNFTHPLTLPPFTTRTTNHLAHLHFKTEPAA